jgi:hypothetical protein
METIVTIIINIISNILESELSKCVSDASFRKFISDNELKVEEFTKKNDGTILIGGNFENYLKYQKPIERIYEFVLNPESEERAENEFIDELVKQCKDSILSSGSVCSMADESVIKDLFSLIHERIKEYLANNLDRDTRYIVYKSKQTGEKVIGEIAREVDRLEYGLEEIRELLKEKNEIDDEKTIIKIYNLLNQKLWNGGLDEVYNILPLVEGKSKDLEYGLKISLGIMSDYVIGSDFLWSNFEKINNAYIRDDVIRKIIFYNYKNSDIIKFIVGKARGKQLKEIIKGLADNDLNKIFSIKTEIKHGIVLQNYVLSREFDEEVWIVKRICLLSLYEQSQYGIAEVMKSLINDDINYIDNILILEKEEIELLSDHSKENNLVNAELLGILTQLKQIKNCFVHSCNIMQKKYFMLLLRTVLFAESEKASVIYLDLPEWIKNEEEIQELMMQLQITNGVATEDEVIKLCMRTGRYWLLNNYLIQWNRDVEKIVSTLEKYIFILEEDYAIFLMYVQAIRILKGKEEASNFLVQYDDKYGNYLEYLLEMLRNTKDKSIVELILLKRKNNELIINDPQSELELIEILMHFKKYDDATEVIKKYEVANRMSSSLYKMKAGVHMAQGHDIDALNILVSNFEHYQKDEYVIDNLIVISLNNKREIPETVLNSACDIGTTRLLMLSAIAYARNERFDLSKKYMTIALLKTKDDNQDIYGNYLGLHLKEENNSKIEITGTDLDTTVYLKNTITGEQRIYCIHHERLLPEEPYIWENAVHIYRESAIQLGLLRKKIGMVIIIEENEYMISEIIPLECYLFRTCMDKMVNNGVAKAFFVETKEDKPINQEKFLQWIKENTQDELSFNWLENYKDINNMPVPIYSLCKFTRLTYEQLILALLEERSIFIRELIVPNEVLKSDGYILSFSAIVMLYKLGVPVSLLQEKNVVIPESAMQEVKEESDRIINDNNREHVSSMGVHNGQIFIQVSTEEEKQQWMSEAIGIKKYCEEIQTADNHKDIIILGLEDLDIKDMFGICDYDTFSIAIDTNRKIVNAEVLIMAVSSLQNSKILAIGLLEFLCEIEMPVIELIGYMHKMLEFRFLLIVNFKAVTYISEKFEEASESEKSNIYLLWDEFLAAIDVTEDVYKQYFTQISTDVMRNKYECDTEIDSIIWRRFSLYVMKYNGFSYNVSINADGELEITTYKIDKE